MTAHEELADKVTDLINGYEFTGVGSDAVARGVAATVLAEVLRTLETVTPEMVTAWDDADAVSPFPTSQEYADATWKAMLHASPLNSTPQ